MSQRNFTKQIACDKTKPINLKCQDLNNFIVKKKKKQKEENREEDRLVTHLGFLQAIQGSER